MSRTQINFAMNRRGKNTSITPRMMTPGSHFGVRPILLVFAVCSLTGCSKVEWRGHTKLDVQIEATTQLTSSYLKAVSNHADSASIEKRFKLLGFEVKDLSNEKVRLVLLQKADNYFLWAQDEDIDFQSVIACSALPPRNASAKLLDQNVYVITTGDGGRRWFTSRFPPVPGCEFRFDLDFGKHKIKYPSSAIERFKFYYPELIEKLRAEKFDIRVSEYRE